MRRRNPFEYCLRTTDRQSLPVIAGEGQLIQRTATWTWPLWA
jgi:hypothetical protein